MTGGITIFPRKFTLSNFEAVITNDNFARAAAVSVSKVLLNLILSLAVTFSAAFSLTRKGLGGRRVFTQKEIASVMGISRSYVSRIEKKALGKLSSNWNNPL